MKNLLLFVLIITCVKFSYQGEVLNLDPFNASYTYGNISIKKYYPLTPEDKTATTVGNDLLVHWLNENKHLDPVKEAKLGPYRVGPGKNITVTLKNYTLSGFSNLKKDNIELRVQRPKKDDQRGRLDLNVTFPEEHISYDVNITTRKEYLGHVEATFKNVSFATITQVHRYNGSCRVLGHDNWVSIPVFQIQLSFPNDKWIENDRNLVQAAINEVKPDVIKQAGIRWIEDLNNFTKSICLTL